MSKGSWRRPTKIDPETFQNNWERVFGVRLEEVIDDIEEPETVGQSPVVEGAESELDQ